MRSSFCNFGDCVEVEFAHGQVQVANSRHPQWWLQFTHEEWAAFLAGVRHGEFDLPHGGDVDLSKCLACGWPTGMLDPIEIRAGAQLTHTCGNCQHSTTVHGPAMWPAAAPTD